ncbi:hypothetical protein ACFORO_12325 [Amycolatopsis halotolerans]|uniref:Uncharacterized protein n=1 Tax=Amycolatopsis halotolerans TaxID=330083 RepID=A0ABV7QHG9_9PSEU
MTLTPEQRSLRASIAANARHAAGGTDTAPARAAFEARFERQVDPDGVLPPEERARRAANARKAYFGTLALKSSIARSKAKKLLAEAEEADAEIEAAGEVNPMRDREA